MRGLIDELAIGILNVEMRMQFTEAVFLSEELLGSIDDDGMAEVVVLVTDRSNSVQYFEEGGDVDEAILFV